VEELTPDKLDSYCEAAASVVEELGTFLGSHYDELVKCTHGNPRPRYRHGYADSASGPAVRGSNTRLQERVRCVRQCDEEQLLTRNDAQLLFDWLCRHYGYPGESERATSPAFVNGHDNHQRETDAKHDSDRRTHRQEHRNQDDAND
jgi:hypothetical protein